MNDRITQVLWVALGVLLAVHFFRSPPRSATAQDAGEIPAVLRARLIELVDERGLTRAQLKVESDGEAVLRMRDAKGTIRVKLGASEDGSGLLLIDDRTEPGVQILAKRAGTTVTLAEKGKEARVLKP
jgi:hypothetical protein